MDEQACGAGPGKIPGTHSLVFPGRAENIERVPGSVKLLRFNLLYF
jgi:hypothetical protein